MNKLVLKAFGVFLVLVLVSPIVFAVSSSYTYKGGKDDRRSGMDKFLARLDDKRKIELSKFEDKAKVVLSKFDDQRKAELSRFDDRRKAEMNRSDEKVRDELSRFDDRRKAEMKRFAEGWDDVWNADDPKDLARRLMKNELEKLEERGTEFFYSGNYPSSCSSVSVKAQPVSLNAGESRRVSFDVFNASNSSFYLDNSGVYLNSFNVGVNGKTQTSVIPAFGQGRIEFYVSADQYAGSSAASGEVRLNGYFGNGLNCSGNRTSFSVQLTGNQKQSLKPNYQLFNVQSPAKSTLSYKAKDGTELSSSKGIVSTENYSFRPSSWVSLRG